MSVYFLNLLAIVMIYYLSICLKLGQKFFLKSALLYLFIISSLRAHSIGTDSVSYVTAFDVIKKAGTYPMERGYVFLNKIALLVTANYTGVIVAVNLLLFIPFYYFVKECVKQDYYWICVFAYAANPYMYIQSTFNILRQTCATGVLLLGTIILLKEMRLINYVLYILFVIIAAQFHKSAFLMLIVIPVVMINWRRLYWMFALAFVLIFRIIGMKVGIKFVIDKFGFSPRYLTYDSSVLDNPLYVMIIALLILYLIIRYHDLCGDDGKQTRLMNLYLFSLCFLIIAVSNDMMYRVYLMLAYVSLPGLPLIIEKKQDRNSSVYIKNEGIIVKWLFIIYYSAFYIGYIVNLWLTNESHYVPFLFNIEW